MYKKNFLSKDGKIFCKRISEIKEEEKNLTNSSFHTERSSSLIALNQRSSPSKMLSSNPISPLSSWQESDSLDAEVDTNSNDSDLYECSDDETKSQSNEVTAKEKKRRQRLTHLTQEEKLMRRKMKNRVAAQSARDRKKAKMEELEVTVQTLREQNDKLKKENKLLREQTQLLINENRKLLRSKMEASKQAQQQLDNQQISSPRSIQIVKLEDLSTLKESDLESKCKKRKLANDSSFGALESAVFYNHVSQQKRQLQANYQKLICILIVYVLNLIKSNQCNNNKKNAKKIEFFTQNKNLTTLNYQQQQHQHQTKQAKLKSILTRLIKMLRNAQRRETVCSAKTRAALQQHLVHHHQPKFEQGRHLNSIVQLTQSIKGNEDKAISMRLMLVISFVMKLISSSNSRIKRLQ
jgi:hypothetical protein